MCYASYYHHTFVKVADRQERQHRIADLDTQIAATRGKLLKREEDLLNVDAEIGISHKTSCSIATSTSLTVLPNSPQSR